MISPYLKILLGLVLMLLGLGYACRPELIARLNRILKETLLNDSYVSLRHKKWGLFLMLIGALLLYMGMSRL